MLSTAGNAFFESWGELGRGVQVLAISRIMVAWQPVGIAAGVYDMCVRYTLQRKQFSKPLAAFQIQQERLARMAGSIQVPPLAT